MSDKRMTTPQKRHGETVTTAAAPPEATTAQPDPTPATTPKAKVKPGDVVVYQDPARGSRAAYVAAIKADGTATLVASLSLVSLRDMGAVQVVEAKRGDGATPAPGEWSEG